MESHNHFTQQLKLFSYELCMLSNLVNKLKLLGCGLNITNLTWNIYTTKLKLHKQEGCLVYSKRSMIHSYPGQEFNTRLKKVNVMM